MAFRYVTLQSPCSRIYVRQIFLQSNKSYVMRDNGALEHMPDGEEVALSLPIKKKDLGAFISGLLGQQQSIERDIEAKFDIDHAWVVNLHETINQRIYQQADAHLTDFTAVIYFENGLKRTFTSFAAFKTYSETKKQIPVGIKIIWIYLVQFPKKQYPEKQQITFSAQIHTKNISEVKTSKNRLEFLILDTITGESERSSLNYQIDHTERTWGDDIETIISNQVDEVIRGNQFKDALFDISRLTLTLIILLFSFIYPVYSIYSSTYHKSQIMTEAMTNYLSLSHNLVNSIDGVNKKLDAVANMIQIVGKRDEISGLLMLMLFAGPPISIILLRLTRKKTYSFLVFSKESERNRASKLEQEKRSTWILVGSFCLSVLAGIVGNYGFAWLN